MQTALPRDHGQRLQTDVIPFGDRFWSELGGLWRHLSGQTQEASVFLSAEWMETWLEVFGPRLSPSAIVWRTDDGSPVACVLLCMDSVRVGPLRLRRAFLNASGDFVAGCEHNDVLVLQAYRDRVLEDLVRVVLDSRPDELALVGFRSRAADDLRARWPVARWEGYSSEGPFVSLDRLRDDGLSYLDALSGNTRSKVRRSVRAYTERFGESELQVAASGQQALNWFGKMVELHEERWHSRGLPGAFSTGEAMEFHTKLIRRSFEESASSDAPSVDIVRVRFGSEPVAILYNLRYRGAVSFYQAGFRYHDDNRMRPGMVAHAAAIEHYLKGGDREYDFLAGEPEPVQYKRSLSTDVRTLEWIQLPSPTLRMATVGWLRRTRRRVRARLERKA